VSSLSSLRAAVALFFLCACARHAVPAPAPKPSKTPSTKVRVLAPRMLPLVRVRGDLPPGASPEPTGSERDVVAMICVDATGRVSDVRVVSGPAGRHTEVTGALGRWQFKPYEAAGERKEGCVPVSFALGPEQ